MLIAEFTRNLLALSGAAARTSTTLRVTVTGGDGVATTVRDNDPAGSVVPGTGASAGLTDLDLSGLTGAGAAVEWRIGDAAGSRGRVIGSARGDILTVVMDGIAGDRGAFLSGASGEDLLTGAWGADELRGGNGRDTLEGGAGDDTLQGDAGDDVLRGGDGIDTAVYSGSAAITVDLRVAGPQATGQGNDQLSGVENLLGGAGDDALTGDGGDNVLDGGGGIDTLGGGAGHDTYVLSDPGDVVVELAGEGDDTIIAAFSHTLGSHVENLTLSGRGAFSATGNAGANRLTGNDAGNRLEGGAGDDTLAGMGGADVLMGGTGNDAYDADATDLVVEYDGEGIDRVRAGASFMLPAFVEQLELTGTADADGTGNDLGNMIVGNAGANRLDGGGGADTLVGGAGDDTYMWDPLDTYIEVEGEGRDRLLSDVTLVLPAPFEDLTLTGIGIKDATGNARANVLTGNDDDNVLDGAGGADTLIGGYGNDTYLVDALDTVVEARGAGLDTVIAVFSYALPDEVENLTLIGAALAGTGNALDNRIEGTAGANTLQGGTGADTLVGGVGDDLYLADADDLIVEAPGSGRDRVIVTGRCELADNVEELVLVGAAAAALRGNAGANAITGNGADNLIDGAGGADTLAGGGGDDTYILRSGTEVVVEAAGGGSDTVVAWCTAVLPANAEVLMLAGAAPLSAFGNPGPNQIFGNAGANRLSGGAGADLLFGGGGDDVYFTDAGDTVVEMEGQGFDIIYSPTGMTLPRGVEGLGLTGTAGALLKANAEDNLISGNAGSDTLIGWAGRDTLRGMAGNDLYQTDPTDVVIEAPGGGWDVMMSVNWVVLFPNVEEGRSLAPVRGDLRGNDLPNRLVGSAGINVLNGLGARDTLIGMAGNDIYIVDALDVIVEAPGGGLDVVLTAASRVLATWVENMMLTGTAPVWGVGNALGNRLIGNDAANRLDGAGGADTLCGKGGGDTYVADNPRDVIVELPGGGYDTVIASVAYALPAQVEVLRLAGAARVGIGNADANLLAGTDLANILRGGGGNDTIFGGGGNDWVEGGTGADRLTGGSGADVFVFQRGGGTDTVTDFQDRIDRIELHGPRSFADLSLKAVAGGTLVGWADTVGFLQGIAPAQLSAADFIFA